MRPVYLVQSDTTVGFLSQDASALDHIKERNSNKSYLKVYSAFKEMKKDHGHIPARYKKELRRAKRRTYIVKNSAFRIVHDANHLHFLKPFRWMYSTSANKSTYAFELPWCEEKADIIVYTKDAFESRKASKLYRLYQTRKQRLR